jgi:hypothetical protein
LTLAWVTRPWKFSTYDWVSIQIKSKLLIYFLDK